MKTEQTQSSVGSTEGSAVYHLIEEGWEMRADDEALGPDCATWWRLDSHPSGRWMIGSPYTRQLFVPVRRAGKYPHAQDASVQRDLRANHVRL